MVLLGKRLLISATFLCLLSKCGETPISTSSNSFSLTGPIIGGNPVSNNGFESTLALMVVFPTEHGPYTEVICTGTLIQPDVVLTAAHCLTDLEFPDTHQTDLAVYVTATNDLRPFTAHSSELPTDIMQVSSAAIHPDFSMDGSGLSFGLGKDNDIALLFLVNPIHRIRPASLIAQEHLSQIVVGTTVTIAGYGQRSRTAGDETEPLKYFGISTIYEIGKAEFQVGDRKSEDAEPSREGLATKCYGDSGGPTFMKAGTEEVLIGITSRSYFDHVDCLAAGIDTRVDYFLDWIEQSLQDGCDNGSRNESACLSDDESDQDSGSGPSQPGSQNSHTSDAAPQDSDSLNHFGHESREPSGTALGCSGASIPSFFGTLVGLFTLLRRRKISAQ